MIIGRKNELAKLKDAFMSGYSEFVAVYGRRRVGKTFLIREAFNYQFTFQHSGVANSPKDVQIAAWIDSLREYGYEPTATIKNWFEAFNALKEVIKKSRKRKKVIFIDEMPWMDTQASRFLPALEFFWNSWASARKDILLIVCGSSTSWIINKIINNHGGLHNRITYKLHLQQFSLKECEMYSEELGIKYNRKQLTELYMILGGVPFYWSKLQRGMSVAQNVDQLFFDGNAIFENEFQSLYASLFKNSEPYIHVVRALSNKKSGLTREQIINSLRIADNGKIGEILEDLVSCGFVRRYQTIGKKKRDALYQLIDAYTIFYFYFIDGNSKLNPHYWSNNYLSATIRTWNGLAFERVCLLHIAQIKEALKIGGVTTYEYTWRSTPQDDAQGVQIDLLLDRDDGIINLCEMKFYTEPFTIDKEYSMQLMHKLNLFVEHTRTRKSLHLTLISPYGLTDNRYSSDIQNVITINDLFL